MPVLAPVGQPQTENPTQCHLSHDSRGKLIKKILTERRTGRARLADWEPGTEFHWIYLGQSLKVFVTYNLQIPNVCYTITILYVYCKELPSTCQKRSNTGNFICSSAMPFMVLHNENKPFSQQPSFPESRFLPWVIGRAAQSVVHRATTWPCLGVCCEHSFLGPSQTCCIRMCTFTRPPGDIMAR